MEDVVGKVQIVVGKGAPYIVIFVAAPPGKFLKLGHDLVVASLARAVAAQPVVDLLAAVQAHDHIVHLFVGELDHVVVHQYAVGGQGKAEILVFVLFDAAGIGHQVLDHLPVHQRFPAEKVHFQIASVARMRHQKIQRLFAHFKAHERPVAMVFALAGKAVFTVQVTGVCHMQAESLDIVAALFEIKSHIGVYIFAVQFAGLLQRLDIRQTVTDLRLGHIRAIAVFLKHPPHDLVLRRLRIQSDHIVCHLVHHVDRAAVHIQHDVIAVEFVLMDHLGFPLCSFSIHRRAAPALGNTEKHRLPHGRQAAPYRSDSGILAVLAHLIGDTAGSLAGRLAGGLALAATAVLHALGQITGFECLDTLHPTSPFLNASPLPRNATAARAWNLFLYYTLMPFASSTPSFGSAEGSEARFPSPAVWFIQDPRSRCPGLFRTAPTISPASRRGCCAALHPGGTAPQTAPPSAGPAVHRGSAPECPAGRPRPIPR